MPVGNRLLLMGRTRRWGEQFIDNDLAFKARAKRIFRTQKNADFAIKRKKSAFSA
jgi:hypothetical protein